MLAWTVAQVLIVPHDKQLSHFNHGNHASLTGKTTKRNPNTNTRRKDVFVQLWGHLDDDDSSSASENDDEENRRMMKNKRHVMLKK